TRASFLPSRLPSCAKTNKVKALRKISLFVLSLCADSASSSEARLSEIAIFILIITDSYRFFVSLLHIFYTYAMYNPNVNGFLGNSPAPCPPVFERIDRVTQYSRFGTLKIVRFARANIKPFAESGTD